MTRPEGGRSAPTRLVLLLWSLLLVVVTADVLLGGPLTRLDHAIVDWLKANWDVHRRFRGRWTTPELVMTPLTEFGGKATVALVVLPFVAYLSARHRTYRPLAQLALTVLVLIAVVVSAKIAFGRAPITGGGALWSGGRSYPSGHTATATATWGLVAALVADHRSGPVARRAAAALAVLAPVAVATSMVLMRWHWLTDVLAGAAVGVLVLAVVRWIDRRVLAHWPGASRGTGAGVAPARAPRVPAGLGGDRGAVHDPRPADS